MHYAARKGSYFRLKTKPFFWIHNTFCFFMGAELVYIRSLFEQNRSSRQAFFFSYKNMLKVFKDNLWSVVITGSSSGLLTLWVVIGGL